MKKKQNVEKAKKKKRPTNFESSLIGLKLDKKKRQTNFESSLIGLKLDLLTNGYMFKSSHAHWFRPHEINQCVESPRL